MLKIFQNLSNLVIYSSLIYLLGSTYYTNKFKLILSLVIIGIFFFQELSKENKYLKAHLYIFPIALIVLFLYGLFVSQTYILSNDLTVKEVEWIYNRSILIFINFTFAIAVYFYTINKSYQQIINLVFFIAAINCIAGMLQLIFPELSRSVSGRLSLLSMEPNHCALHYMFVFWLVYYNNSSIPTLNFLGKVFLIVGLFVRSKIQLIALMITSLFNNFKNIFLILPLVFFLFNFSGFLSLETKNEKNYCASSTICDQAYFLSEDLNRFSTFILDEDKSVIDLKPSYYTRLFSFYHSFSSSISNPLGLGWGGFNTYFQQEIKKSKVHVNIIGDDSEQNQILSGDQESTPKSNLLEILVSTGWLGIVLLIILLFYFLKYRTKNKSVFLTFFSILITGLFVETAPFLGMIAVTYVLLLKSMNK